MQAVKNWLKKEHHISPLWAILLILASSVLVTLVMLSMSHFELYIMRYILGKGHYLMLLLNWLPIFLFMLLLFFFTSSAALSISVVSFLGIVMAIVNATKIQMRGDPLLHWDFTLFGEMLGIAGGFGAKPIIFSLLGIAAFIALSILLGKHVKSRRLGVTSRVVGTLLCIAVMFAANATLYTSKAIYESLPVWGSFYNLADVHKSKGNLYAFLYNWNTSRSASPEGYDAFAVKAFAAEYEQVNGTETATAVQPHIIMIMGEAFSDISESSAFDFTGYRDPLEAFKALGAEGIYGHIVVPSRGGGTADTEFDVLTAQPSRYLRNAPYAYRMLAAPAEAMPSLLSGIGYDTFSLHPGYRWFYNRQNAYRYLGFEESVFEDAFPKEAYMDTFISEEATFDMLLSMLDTQFAKSPGTPFFGFCLTIQNHAAYLDRYLPKDTYNFTPTIPMDDEERNILSNYFAGTIDADTQLARLATYLQEKDEPVILVYFGDHLPAFAEGLYPRILQGGDAPDGSLAKETYQYTVPFIIWGNDAAKGLIPTGTEPTGLPEGNTISSNYLGAYVMEMLGLDTLSPYWQYANTMRKTFPVVLEDISYTPDGQDDSSAGETERQMLRDFRNWVYYRMTESIQ